MAGTVRNSGRPPWTWVFTFRAYTFWRSWTQTGAQCCEWCIDPGYEGVLVGPFRHQPYDFQPVSKHALFAHIAIREPQLRFHEGSAFAAWNVSKLSTCSFGFPALWSHASILPHCISGDVEVVWKAALAGIKVVRLGLLWCSRLVEQMSYIKYSLGIHFGHRNPAEAVSTTGIFIASIVEPEHSLHRAIVDNRRVIRELRL